MKISLLRQMLILFVFLLFIPVNVLAERPFLSTETAIPTERGTYRLAGGLRLDRFSSQEKKTELRLNIRYGLVQNLEFDLEIPYLFVSGLENKKNHPGDILLKTKIRFIKGRAANPLSIAGQMIVKFPTAGKDPLLDTSGVVDVGFLAIASKSFWPVTAHINFGYFFIGNPAGEDVSDQIRYALGLDFQVADTPVKLIGELFGSDTNSDLTTDDESVVMGGFSLRAHEQLTFDTTVGFGLNNNSPDYIINIGATYILH